MALTNDVTAFNWIKNDNKTLIDEVALIDDVAVSYWTENANVALIDHMAVYC